MYSSISINLLLIPKITNISNVRFLHHVCKILVVGGGTGGCAMAAKLSRKFDKTPNHVIVLEPNEVHYYQPMFTLIGAGIKSIKDSKKLMKDVLPKNAQWIKDNATTFKPEENLVTTLKGDTIQYELMIVAMGLQLYWDKIPGLVKALKEPESQVCSIYGPDTVSNVFQTIKKTKEGNAVFSFPNTPVKCPGAPQKIVYLSEDYWCSVNKRKNINIIYNTSLPVIFGVKKYADALWGVCKRRNIEVNTSTNLIEIIPAQKEAIFQDVTNPNNVKTLKYSMLHVSPPQGAPEILRNNKMLTNEAGFLDVHPSTLQHKKFKNIFGLGDCTSTPNSKTMAAIASQNKILYDNIKDYLAKKEMKSAYTGYASCPLVTARGKCILAEFDYNLKPQETFPFDQSKELKSMYLLKKDFFPFLYWNLMLKGHWDGPETFKKLFSFFKKDEVLQPAKS